MPNTPCTVEGWLVRYGGIPPSPGPPRPDAPCGAPELFAPAAGPDPGVGAGAGLGMALRFDQSKKPLPLAGGPPRGGCDPFVAPVG